MIDNRYIDILVDYVYHKNMKEKNLLELLLIMMLIMKFNTEV